MSSVKEIYARHPGPYSLLLTVETDKGVKRSEHLHGRFSAADAHAEAIDQLAKRPAVRDIHIYCLKEGQFCGAEYLRGETYLPWDQLEEPRAGRMDVYQTQEADGQREAALLHSDSDGDGVAGEQLRHESLQPMDPPEPGCLQPDPRPEARRVRDVPPQAPSVYRAPRAGGQRLCLASGQDERWPKAQGPQIALAFFLSLAPGVGCTTAEFVAALGPKLTEIGVAHPASLISRLKQAGLLKEAA